MKERERKERERKREREEGDRERERERERETEQQIINKIEIDTHLFVRYTGYLLSIVKIKREIDR